MARVSEREKRLAVQVFVLYWNNRVSDMERTWDGLSPNVQRACVNIVRAIERAQQPKRRGK